MVLALLGLGRSQGDQAPSRGWNLSQTILPEGGILAMAFDGAVGLADKVANTAVGFAESIGNGATNAASAAFALVTQTSAAAVGSEPARVQEPKLGANAVKTEILAAMETQPQGPNHASLADLFTSISGQNFDGATRATSQGVGK